MSDQPDAAGGELEDFSDKLELLVVTRCLSIVRDEAKSHEQAIVLLTEWLKKLAI